MVRYTLHPTYRLSYILLFFLIVQSVGSLFIPDLYSDNKWVVASVKGADLLTLVIVSPLLGISLFYATRGSIKAQIILLGVVYFVFYSSFFSFFGTSYNSFLLIFLSIFLLSVFSFANGLLIINPNKIMDLSIPLRENKLINTLVLLCLTILLLVWLSQFFIFLFTGRIAPIFLEAGNFAQLTAKINLAFIVVPGYVALYWFRKNKPLGYVLTIIFLITGLLICLLMFFIAVSQSSSNIIGGWDLIPLWSIIMIICLWCAVRLFKYIKTN